MKNKNSSIQKGSYIDYSPINFSKRKKNLHREISKTFEAEKEVSVFNDSLMVKFQYIDSNFPKDLFLYIVSEEIGESRKAFIKVGDTIQIMHHIIIVESQIENPNNSNPLVNFKFLKYVYAN